MEKPVEKAFKTLEGIQPVAVPEKLYAQIQNRLAEPKTLPLYWVRAAAAVMMLLIATEFYWVAQYNTLSQNNEIESLLPNTNDGIYYE